MANYKKIIVTTNSYNVTDMVSGTTPICDTKVLSGSSWVFTASELPATVYYETNETPKTKRLLISSDTDHITDRTGRVQDTINRVFYKNMCKEFTSNGEAITVNNGMDGYVLQSTIQGQTVKCYDSYKFPDGIIINSQEGLGGWKNVDIKANTKISVVFDKEYNFRICINGDTGGISVTKNKNIFNFTAPSDITTIAIISNVQFVTNNTWYCVCDETTGVKGFVEKGLSSTQATISNLGLKYSF